MFQFFKKLYGRVQAFLQFGEAKRTGALRSIMFYAKNNYPLTDCLEELTRFASHDGANPGDYAAKTYEKWRRKIAEGKSFSFAISGDIPEIERQLIAAAEQQGKLDKGIEEALKIREGLNKIRRQLSQAFIYPIILLMGATGYFLFMSSRVFPGFVSALPVAHWPKSTLSLMQTSDFVSANLFEIYGFVAVICGIFFWSLSHWTGSIRASVDRYAPYSLYRIVYGTVFLMSLAGYIKSGMNTPLILQYMLRTANPWYAERLRAFQQGVKRGLNFGDAMTVSQMEFPSREVVANLRSFAKFKQFDQALNDLGTEILARAISQIEMQSVVLRNVMIFGFAVMLIWFTDSTWDFQAAVTHAAQSGL